MRSDFLTTLVFYHSAPKSQQHIFLKVGKFEFFCKGLYLGLCLPNHFTNTMWMHWLWLGRIVNAVFSLRNWRGNPHLRAFGPSVHIAPPISQTSDRIHWCVLPRVNAFSHCVGKTIWFILSGQLGINRCHDRNSFWIVQNPTALLFHYQNLTALLYRKASAVRFQ